MCLPIMGRVLYPPPPQRVLGQATGSAQKGAQVQQLSVPRLQQVPQQVHTVSSPPRLPSLQPPGHSISRALSTCTAWLHHSSIRHVDTNHILHCIVSVVAFEWYWFLTNIMAVRAQSGVLQVLSRDFLFSHHDTLVPLPPTDSTVVIYIFTFCILFN